MKKIYIGAMAIGSLLATSCAKDNLNTTSEDPGSSTSAQNTEEVGGLTLKAEIQTWQEDQSLRALGWDIADASATNDGLVPKVKYTQQEFSGGFAPAENIPDATNLRVPTYYTGQNQINPNYTDVNIKLRRPVKDKNGKTQNGGVRQYRFTVWNGRDYNSGVKGGKGMVELSEVDGRQSLNLYLPMQKLAPAMLLFDGEWYLSVSVGGRSGGWNTYEGMCQYYGPSGNGTIESLYDGTTTSPLNAYNQFGSSKTPKFGAYPAFTEPNRLEPTTQSEYASFFGLVSGSTTNPTNPTTIRKGLGLKEQTGSVSGMKRHFPMMSRFYQLTGHKGNQWAATGDNSANYGQVKGIVIEPRGTILAFKVKNTLDKPIRVQSITGNHGGTFNGYQAEKLANGGIVLKQRAYKAISYQGFYSSGWVGNAEFGGFPEADMKSGQKIPFVGMSTGPEEFPLVAQDGTQGIVLQPGQETTGRFYLWFTADPGAEFKIRMKYDELAADGTASASALLSKPQKVNPGSGVNFEEGKVYGALISVKPN
ncbi:MAG: hypothetical protein SOW66_05730 [Porphyromonas sp.]|nr:hypothetical protein [Porphyromonas sp.]